MRLGRNQGRINSMTDGEKAIKVRAALIKALEALPDTAHGPRHTIRAMRGMPSVVLAVFFDALVAL